MFWEATRSPVLGRPINSRDKGQNMRKQMTKVRLVLLAAVVAGFATMGFASSASAHSGNFSAFNYCPWTTTGVVKCVQSVTKGGKVILGKKTVPIVNPVTLQGGIGKSEFQPN